MSALRASNVALNETRALRAKLRDFPLVAPNSAARHRCVNAQT
ncbi:hypothetical protein U91I_01949 [alpha proteobacterium U9-1i]|nr:hypothetical protein U91I_01949 [alpha proteobacterium U9-1i]